MRCLADMTDSYLSVTNKIIIMKLIIQRSLFFMLLCAGFTQSFSQGTAAGIFNKRLVAPTGSLSGKITEKKNGNPLPAGTYYYIIDPKNGRKQMSGFVDIIR